MCTLCIPSNAIYDPHAKRLHLIYTYKFTHAVHGPTCSDLALRHLLAVRIHTQPEMDSHWEMRSTGASCTVVAWPGFKIPHCTMGGTLGWADGRAGAPPQLYSFFIGRATAFDEPEYAF